MKPVRLTRVDDEGAVLSELPLVVLLLVLGDLRKAEVAVHLLGRGQDADLVQVAASPHGGARRFMQGHTNSKPCRCATSVTPRHRHATATALAQAPQTHTDSDFSSTARGRSAGPQPWRLTAARRGKNEQVAREKKNCWSRRLTQVEPHHGHTQRGASGPTAASERHH